MQQERLGCFHALENEVTMNRRSKGALEGTREMTHREPTLFGELVESQLLRRMLIQQLTRAAHLPWC